MVITVIMVTMEITDTTVSLIEDNSESSASKS